MKNKIKSLSLFLPLIAQNVPEDKIEFKPNDPNFGALQSLTIGSIIGGGIRLILIIASVVFFFILVYGGIRWIISGGDKAQTETARNQITAALVGLVIVFAAWAIVQLIATFFGINIFSLDLPTAGE